MKNKYLVGLLVLGLSVGVFAQKAKVAKTPDVEANVRKHIAYLTSDRLEGRRTGETGATSAAGYVANMFSALRLTPGAKTKTPKFSYMQMFPYVTGVEMGKTGNSFTLELTLRTGSRIKVENMVPAKPVGFSPNGSVDAAKVIFAGFGITSSEPKFDDYAGTDVRGKVVVIFDGYPDYDNPQSPYRKFDARTKALIAKDHGAVGVLLISRETNYENDKLTQLKYDQTLGEAALPTFVISRNTAENIIGTDKDALTLVEGLIAIRSDAVVKTSYPKFNTDTVVSFGVNLVKKRSPAYNIIGILPGTDPKLKDEAIIIGAHYDHLGRGGAGSLAPNSTDVHHGADDNASGTSAILELARGFAARKNNKRTIIFIAFSGEEEGLLGSKAYVENPIWPLDKTIAMLNLDMVGRLRDDKLNIGGMGTASEWNQLVKRANDIMFDTDSGYGVGRKFNLVLNEDGYGPSDHASFYGKKVPVLFFFTGSHEDYHKPSDTAEKINYEGETRIVAYIASIARAIDEAAVRPTYTMAQSSGPGVSRSGSTVSLGTIPGYGDSNDGMVVDGVRDNSPASRAGIKAGDKIINLNGKEVRNAKDYTFVIGTLKAGEEYEIVIQRGSEKMTLKITPVKRQ